MAWYQVHVKPMSAFNDALLSESTMKSMWLLLLIMNSCYFNLIWLMHFKLSGTMNISFQQPSEYIYIRAMV